MSTHRPHRVVVLAAALVALATACSNAATATDTGTETTMSIGPLTTATATASATPSRTVEPERSAPTAPSSADPAVAGVDRTSIDAVATAVVTAFTTADTTVDTGPNDAAARTVGLLTADYAAAILNTPPLRSPGAQWNSWTAQGVRLAPSLEALSDDRPADTDTTATRIYLVTQTPTTATGQVLAPVVTVAYVGLARAQAGWAVSQVQQR